MATVPAGRPAARWQGALCGLGAAALFGASTPVAKLLLPATGPVLLAALLYLGGGIGLTAFGLLRGHDSATREPPLRKADFAPLLGIVVAGGVLGPLLMLFGLGRVSAVAASLLLNLEAPFTILLAVLLFGEHLGGRAAVAAALIIGGLPPWPISRASGVSIGWAPSPSLGPASAGPPTITSRSGSRSGTPSRSCGSRRSVQEHSTSSSRS